MEDDINNSCTSTNLIVQKAQLSNIQIFMQSWLKQPNKDFRIVFLKNNNTSKEEKQAISYALGFADALRLNEYVAVFASEAEAPKAKQTKILKDTSILPNDADKICAANLEDCKELEKTNVALPENKRQEYVNNDAAKMMLQQKPIDNEVGQKKEVEKVEAAKPIEKVFFKIIVPNYNNIAYIKKCLDSILEQTFQDFKIIVVDDLSTDGSDKFCEMYARKHPDKILFIKLKEKGYPGKARNVGLQTEILSEYVWFIDGDDFVYSKNVLQELYQYAKSKKYDAIFFSGYDYINGKLQEITDRSKIDISKPGGCNPTYHTCKIIKPLCCGEYLEKCMTGQDLYHSYKSFDNIKTYLQIPNRYYVYRYNQTSVTHRTQNIQSLKIREQHRYILLDELIKLCKEIKNNNVVQNIQERIQIVKKRIDIEKKRISSKRKIVVAMASFPARKNGMLTAIKQLIDQCDHFYLWLNDYDEIPIELKKFDSSKLTIKLAKEKSFLKENGRYTWINDEQNSYYLTVDDDINYPSNYVQILTFKIDQYNGNCILSFHGTRFVNGREVWFPFTNHNVPNDAQVHRVGGGVMGFIPSQIKFICPNINELAKWDGDASISVWATLHKVKKYVIAHTSNYLTQQKNKDNSLIALTNALCLSKNTIKKRKREYAKIKQWESIS